MVTVDPWGTDEQSVVNASQLQEARKRYNWHNIVSDFVGPASGQISSKEDTILHGQL
jgi:hypothetical protein